MVASPFASWRQRRGGAEEVEEGGQRGERGAGNSASGSHWPACQGQRPQRRPLPSWHPPGVCTSIAPGAALTINILNFFKMQKPHQQTLDHSVFQSRNFLHFFRVVCSWGGWLWPQWVGGKGWASGASSPRLACLLLASSPACIGAGTPTPQHCCLF